MKILLTGGHVTPAYAFAEYALKQGDSLHYVSAAPRSSFEAAEINRLGIPYHHLHTVKFDRHQAWQSVMKSPLLFKSFYQALRLLKWISPDLIVTFGSFNAVPVAYAARLLSIPVVMHEQTLTTGLANQLISPIASLKAASYGVTGQKLNGTVITGNILRKTIWEPPIKPPFPQPITKPILYITGGNQGSAAINETVAKIVSELAVKYEVFWQTGNWQPSQDFPKNIVRECWFEPKEASWLLHHARLIISRAGANTVAEIAAVGVPAVFIPLPKSSGNEQTKNAALLTDAGAALTIPQKDLSPKAILKAIEQIESDYSAFKSNAQNMRQSQRQDAVISLYQAAVKYA